MRHFRSIDHIGYAVRDIEKTALYYVAAWWNLSEIMEEKVQHTKIAFLKKEGFQRIELVSPLGDGIPSPVDNVLQKNGCTTYHVCYTVDNINDAVDELYDEGFKPLFEPVESIAMEGKKICYLFHLHVGLIEIVEE